MKKMKKRIIPLIAIAAVLVNLAGCNSVPKGYVPEGYVPEGYVPEGYVPAGYISIEDARALFSALTLPVGYLDGTSEEISDEEGDKISKEIMEMEESYVAAGAPEVNGRDWSIYTSQLARESLTFEEAAFYDRLDELCRKYMDNAALDGVKREDNGRMVSDMVRFDDLNLNADQAKAVAFWFKYNNPQYYFITSSVITIAGQKLCFCIYDFAADGEERVKITNELFDKLDGWIETANSGGATTWEKEISANNLLCKNIVYNDEYVANHDLMGQTLYSAVMLGGTVCAGYSAAFCAIMNASGIETAVALSPTHAWNVVRYDDGNHYAVDVTWNDNKNDDDNPNNGYFNVGEVTLKKGDGGAHTYSSKYIAWSPELSQDDCSKEYSSAVQLAVPQNLHVTSDEDGKIHFTWDPVDGASGYYFEIYNSDMTRKLNGTFLEGTSVSVTYKSYSSLSVRVRAEGKAGGAEGVSGWSEFLTADTAAAQLPESDTVKLDVPQNVRVTRDEARRTSFAWDEVEGADQYEFVLFKDAGHQETWSSSFKSDPADGYIKLQPGRTYYYGLRAVKTVDGENYYSDWNYFSHETPGESTSGAAPDLPAPPANVKVVATGEDRTLTTWDAVPGATGYQIRLYRDPEYKEIWTEFSKTGTKLSLEKIQKDVTYYYRIRTVKAVDGQEVFSDWVDFSYSYTETN